MHSTLIVARMRPESADEVAALFTEFDRSGMPHRMGSRRITSFDPAPFRSRVAAEVDFDPEAHGLTPREIRRMDRAAQFAVVTAREAVLDSGLDLAAPAPGRIGVTIGATTGLDHEYAVPHLYNYLVPSSFATEVAWAVGAAGPGAVVSTGCTSGLDAVGYAAEVIREGAADVVVAGATDAPRPPPSHAPRSCTPAPWSCWPTGTSWAGRAGCPAADRVTSAACRWTWPRPTPATGSPAGGSARRPCWSGCWAGGPPRWARGSGAAPGWPSEATTSRPRWWWPGSAAGSPRPTWPAATGRTARCGCWAASTFPARTPPVSCSGPTSRAWPSRIAGSSGTRTAWPRRGVGRTAAPG
ncbi:putative ketoacyl synthase [Saccharothrix espanaensis DSM 44229]|uniref:Putative ketoacyl synthase n=1 Tax=Saccharothrix espanaensis (strain ATCC 51144 / DSM 44229 / JCM 9112 / NBRC 15066 / NRRL 15764) TaxID=1179773 RepID=K0JZ31_SACES|nr:TcmI family type II polyketide cyclase [Saccharothrix espanaensis]CCH31386.1 putative ketoacyl synthase [Saccharothrix espanaensis DSM 44229]